MEYSNPKIPEGINVTVEHPLKEFLQLTFGILAVAVAMVAVLAVAAEYLARFIPFSYEREIAASDSSLFPEATRESAALQALADQLATAQGLPADMGITAHYVDEDTVNAMATLGGHLIVYRGLLELMPHENALAMVLAHEIAHIKHRHPLQALGRGIVIGVGLAVIAGVSGSDVAGRALGQAGILTVLRFSRGQEAAADREALATLARHYGHVAGASTFFESLQQRAQAHHAASIPEFFGTHPLTERRLRALRAEAVNHDWPTAGRLTPLPAELKLEGVAP